MPASDQVAVFEVDLPGELAHDRVVLEQVGDHLVVGQIVDGDDLDARLGALVDDPEDRPADPAEAVDGYLVMHFTSFSKDASFSMAFTTRAA